MNKTTFNFTRKTLLTLPCSKKGVTTYHDTTKRGLKLAVRPTGSKTFFLYRKIKGRPERIMIGRFPDLTVEQARKQIDVLNSKIVQGINPNEEKRLIKNEMILKDLFSRYLESYAKVHKKSWRGDQEQFNRYLDKNWGKRKLSSIRKSDIQKLHAEIGEKSGYYAANRLLALLHTIFNKAGDWGWKQENPAHGIKKFKEKSRDRFMQADELPRFFEALREENNETIRDYIMISLLTGARRSNVLSMRWDQINIERKEWRIPETKTGESHTVPLVSAAIDLLKERQKKNKINENNKSDKNNKKEDWVFPSTGKTGHLVEPKKAWNRILERANITDLRIHDLRRSLGSWLAMTGANLSIIGKTLAHKNVSTTAIYARLSLDPVRTSMNKATDEILKAANMSHVDDQEA